MTDSIALTLSPEALDQLVERLADCVLERLTDRNGMSPWLTRTEAAAYVRLPVSRLEKDRTIPCHRDGRRVLYHRAELDRHFGAP